VPGILTHSPARIAAQLLIDLGLGTTPNAGGDQGAWPVFYDNLPNAPNNAVAVVDTQGIDFMRDSFGDRNRHHGFQVVVRGGTHDVGYAKANAIAAALDNVIEARVVTVDGSDYCVGMARTAGDVLRLGPEPNSTRRRFSVNGLIYVRASDGS
jgi:hypothetical protein